MTEENRKAIINEFENLVIGIDEAYRYKDTENIIELEEGFIYFIKDLK